MDFEPSGDIEVFILISDASFILSIATIDANVTSSEGVKGKAPRDF
jgi:hypothetical protein